MLNSGIEHLTKVMHYPLSDAGCEVLFGVGTDRVKNRDDEHGDGSDFEHPITIAAGQGYEKVVQPSVGALVADDVVENDLQRPRIEQIGSAFSDNGEQSQGKSFAMWTEQVRDREFAPSSSGHG